MQGTIMTVAKQTAETTSEASIYPYVDTLDTLDIDQT